MLKDGEYTWERPFWEQPLWRWDAMFRAEVRAHYVASHFAVKLMIAQQSGLIVNLSFWSAQKYMRNVAYGVSKAATDKLTTDMAEELKAHKVSVVSLYPGLVRTELARNVVKHLGLTDMLDESSESPQFVGRGVAALAADPNVMQKSGQILITGALGLEYGFKDIDGKQPPPSTLEDA
jgi:NAD(P)-dependent dehydrogenase (short-subunit alcohol dehydrogenase family)